MTCQSKFNDPFGRVGRRQARSYEDLKSRLQAAGIGTVGALDEAQHRIKRLAWLLVAIVVGVTGLVLLTFPPWRGLVTVLGGLALTWLGATAVRTQLHLKRYRRELEVQPHDEPSDASETNSPSES
ncbi:MAG: hypothetical protein PVF93_01195 [Chromatiaceae bacterium]|jgi:Flp pilus assembly protein TadB